MREARVNDTVVRYQQSGKGPVALFLHGFPLDHTMWQFQWEDLSDVRTCVAPDLRGFGASATPGPELLTMDQHALDMVDLLDHLDVGRADIIGLSMGGYVALALQALHPERFRSLALIDTRANADDQAARANRDAVAERLVHEGRETWTHTVIPPLIGPDASVFVRARLRAMIEGTRYETIVAALEGMKDRPDQTDLLPRIETPTVVICGEHDSLTPPALSRAMADAIPGARLELIPGAGHMSPLERPDAVNAALRAFWGVA